MGKTSHHEEASQNLSEAVVETVGQTVEKYRQLYGLPALEHVENVDYRFFLQAKRGAVFVVVAAYNHTREFLVIRNFSRGSGWELIGGFVEIGNSEGPEYAVSRVVRRECSLDAVEMTPIAVVKNVFVCGKERITHIGLAYIAECEGSLSFSENIVGDFSSHIPRRMLASDREVLALARKRLKEKTGVVPTEEIHSVHRFQSLIWIHEHVVSPFVHPFSSALMDSSLLSLIGRPASFLDVAAGDDDLVLKVYRRCHPFLCVANDITSAATKFLHSLTKGGEDVIFTNHNVLDLPFAKKFDVVLCKNTLHHMHSRAEIHALLTSLKKISKRLILVDVENPRTSSFRAKVWNWYYREFLGDQGGYFLSRPQFTETIQNFFPDCKKQFSNISTIKGNYMVVIVEVGK